MLNVARSYEYNGMKIVCNPALKENYDRSSFGKYFSPIQVSHEDHLGFLMSSVAQSQAEIVTEGVFLRNPVLKEIYDR